MQNQFPIKKNLKKFWAGKISFGKSFWLWYFVGGSILSIPFFLITDSAIDSSTGVAAFTVLYFLFFIITLLFLIIGTWKSAENYKKNKKKKKQGYAWAIAAQVYITLSLIRGIAELIKNLSQI
jgi:hypothetical protein